MSCGSTIVNRVMPGSLVTSTEPWWAATTASTIASPSPVEDALMACDRDVSALVNRSKSSGSRSAGMPGPLSVTVSTRRGVAGSVPRLTEVGGAPRTVLGCVHGSVSLTRTVTVLPSGVCRPALDSRLART